MKIFTLILSMYVMLLTGVSCDDALYEPSASQSTTFTAHENDATDCIIDLCSPFCSCTCCVGFNKPKVVLTTTILPEVALAKIIYTEKAYSSERHPLFQPPRV